MIRLLDIVRSILYEQEYTNLKVTSFKDRETRVNTLIDKLKQGQPLTLQKGLVPITVEKVGVKQQGDEEMKYFDSTNFEKLKEILPSLKPHEELVFVGTDKKVYPISTIAKTPELGGLGKGATLAKETAALADLNNQVAELGGNITVVFNGEKYKDITGAVNIPGQPKADFALADKSGPKIYISYKDGSTAKGFHHYGGISRLNSPTVDSFVNAVKKKTMHMQKGDVEYGIPLDPSKDADIIRKAMYGIKYGSNSYGVNNVQGILQGNIKLVPTGTKGEYNLTATKVILPPTIPTDDEYRPYLTAMYAGDRNQKGIENCRFRILPAKARGKFVNPFKSSK